MNEDLLYLANGRVPEDASLLRGITVGLDKVSGFFRKQYFSSYLKEGGSKVRFICGRKGCGKTHLLRLLALDAREEDFLTVSLDARSVNLFDFSAIYLAIIARVDIEAIASSIARSLALQFGQGDWDSDGRETLLEHMASARASDSLVITELRTELRRLMIDDAHIDGNMATAFSLLAGFRLGIFDLKRQDRDVLIAWLKALRPLKAKELRPLGLSPYKIDKYNARGMVRSLACILHLAGYGGLLVEVDNFEAVATNRREMGINYTKKRRDDTYESVRALVDDIDNFRYTMFVFAFDRVLLDDAAKGMKSYQALWLRVQNEIISSRMNLFQDLLDLDAANSQLLGADELVEMSRRLARAVEESPVSGHEITRQEADEIIRSSAFTSLSIPLLVSRKTLGVEGKEDAYGRL